MSDLLCIKCNHEIHDDINKIYNYLATFKNNKNIYKKIIVDNIDLDSIDKKLYDIIEIHNKKFNIYFVKCLFNIRFNDDIYELDTVYIHNKEIYKIFIQFLFFIDMMKSEGRIFINIDKLTIDINSDICNITEEYSEYMRWNPIEKQINIIFGKNPQSLNQISNNILIRNKSHRIFNI